MPVRAIVRANSFPTLLVVGQDGHVEYLDHTHPGNVGKILGAQLVYA